MMWRTHGSAGVTIPKRHGRLAVPVGLALTASLAFLSPVAASAAPLGTTAGAAAAARPDASGPELSYVANLNTYATVTAARKAVERAGGTVVTSYEQIGVIVAHSQNPTSPSSCAPSAACSSRSAPPAPPPSRRSRRPRRHHAAPQRGGRGEGGGERAGRAGAAGAQPVGPA
ncbi:hypothetical protein ACFSNO_19680, partial [Streptomyces cirratus]